MLVNWKVESGILAVPLIDTTIPAGKDDRPVYNYEQVALLPGWNDVPAEKFQLMLPHIRNLIDEDQIEFYAKRDRVEEEVEVEVDGKKVKEIRVTEKYVDQELRDIRADKAREIVKGCYNKKNLRAWQDDAKLATEIRNLVDMQISKIDNYSNEETTVRL